jgi:PAS domain S-box-containing protein
MNKTALSAEKMVMGTFFIFMALFFSYFSNYYSSFQMPFYSILFQLIISFIVFVLSWNSRHWANSSFIPFLGTAFLFIGFFDIGQLVCLKWMDAFNSAIGSSSLLSLNRMSVEEARAMNYASQLWLIARYYESVSLMISFFFLQRRVAFHRYFFVFAMLAIILSLSVFQWHLFPECFNKEQGFTQFKDSNHLILSTVFLFNIGVLFFKQRHFERKMFSFLSFVLILAALSEYGFSWSLIQYNVSRPIAHMFKCISTYLIYHVVISAGFINPIGLLFSDIRKKELYLAQERDRLFSILDILPSIIYVLTPDNAISYANRRFKDLFGQIKDRRCHDLFFNCRNECDDCPAKRVLTTKLPASFEWKAEDGRTFVIYHGYFIDSDGLPKVLGSGIDITERILAQSALKLSEDRFRTFYKHTPVMLHTFDKSGRILNVNDHWLTVMGYGKEVVVGREWVDFLSPESRLASMNSSFAPLLESGVFKEQHFELQKSDSTVMDIEMSASMESEDTGSLGTAIAISIDVTEKVKTQKALKSARKELETRVKERTFELDQKTKALEKEIRDRIATEEAMKEAEAQYGLLVENSLTGIYIKQHGKIIFANDRFCKIHDYRKDEIIGIDSWRLVYQQDRAMVDAYSKRRLENIPSPDTYESRRLTKNGNVIWVAANNTRIIYRDAPAILGNLMDITLRKKVEAKLKKSESDLKLLSARLLSAQENERKRIAIELHDTIAQNLVMIKFTLGQKLKQMNGLPPTGSVKIEDIIDIVQENIIEVRRIMTDLRPSLLDDLGIIPTIRWHCREFQKIYTHITINQIIELEESDVPEDLKIVIYRIMQEAMNNTAKHSNASLIELTLCRFNGTFELTIEDNGGGFDYQQVLAKVDSSTGLGLVGMRERTEQSFGVFSISSRINKGTRINARWEIGKNGDLVSLKNEFGDDFGEDNPAEETN